MNYILLKYFFVSMLQLFQSCLFSEVGNEENLTNVDEVQLKCSHQELNLNIEKNYEMQINVLIG